jgi:hypothetical protein
MSSALERLPAEAQLVFRIGAEPDDDEVRALAARVTDWDLLFRLSVNEHAAVLLWPRLHRLGIEVPADVRAAAARLCAVLTFRNAQLAVRLRQVTGVLDAAGIDVVLLKGAALALSEYDSVAERPMSDFDLLVAPERAWDAHRALRDAGWVWDDEGQPAGMFARHHHLPQLADPRGTSIKIELHTDLFLDGHSFLCDGELIRRRARPLESAGPNVYVPDRVEHLVYMSIHFAWSHMMASGAWRAARDLRAMMRHGVDWDAVVVAARRARAASCCYWMLRMARELMAAEVPAGVLAALAPPGVPRLLLDRLARRFAAQLAGTAPPRRFAWTARLAWSLAIQPQRSGHGAVRPWTNDPDFAPLHVGVPSRHGSGMRRVRDGARSLLRIA